MAMGLGDGIENFIIGFKSIFVGGVREDKGFRGKRLWEILIGICFLKGWGYEEEE